MSKDNTPDRWRKFAIAYARLGNGTKAAIEAGFAAPSAHVTASRLLRRAKIQELLGAQRVNREAHAEQTYKNLIFLADAALKEASTVCGWSHPESKDPDPQNRARAIDVAGKALGRVAKVEGLFVERVKIEGDVRVHTLIEVAQRLKASTPRIVDSVQRHPALLDLKNDNGNGHSNGNGNGHSGDTPSDC